MTSGPGLNHIELWVEDLAAARASWGWLLDELGWEWNSDWVDGSSWSANDDLYLVVTSPPKLRPGRHDRRMPGLNHLALTAPSAAFVNLLRKEAPEHGWTPLYDDRFPHAGGPHHYALYLENAQGFKVEVVVAS
ncbi:MAG TPA: VOC family protein [Gryllotalpicola sp.]